MFQTPVTHIVRTTDIHVSLARPLQQTQWNKISGTINISCRTVNRADVGTADILFRNFLILLVTYYFLCPGLCADIRIGSGRGFSDSHVFHSNSMPEPASESKSVLLKSSSSKSLIQATSPLFSNNCSA